MNCIVLQGLNPGKATFGTPYNSTQGFSYDTALFLFIITLAAGFYIAIRVKQSLNKSQKED